MRGTLTKTTEETDTEFGFIWGTIEDKYYLRTPDEQYKGVSRHVVETLREKATKTSIEELIATVDEDQSSAADVLQEMHEEGFIRKDAPIERMEPPDDVALWPRVLWSALMILVVGAIWVNTVTRLSGPAFDGPLSYAPEAVVITLVTLIVGLAIHERGHYRTATRQGVDATIGVSVINGILPAIITRTNDSWALPRNRRMWISLAGPIYGLVWTLVVFLVYYTVWPHPGVAIAALMCFNSQIAPLIPIYHGDGYFIISDILGKRNLRTSGWNDLKRFRVSWPAGYVVASYGTVIVMFGINLVAGFLIADWTGVAVLLGILSVSFVIRAWRRLSNKIPIRWSKIHRQ